MFSLVIISTNGAPELRTFPTHVEATDAFNHLELTNVIQEVHFYSNDILLVSRVIQEDGSILVVRRSFTV